MDKIIFLYIYYRYIRFNNRTKKIIRFNTRNLDKELLNERGLPNRRQFPNGWWKNMLIRYGIAIHHSKGKDVLDACSGLGWGGYLLDEYARSVTCIDNDKNSIGFAKSAWKGLNTEYSLASIIDHKFERKFDVITLMDSIEHFDRDTGEIILTRIFDTLKNRGIFICSSSFPATKQRADSLCKKNYYHKHIYTWLEFYTLLQKIGFRRIKSYGKIIFIAERPGGQP